MYVPSTVWVLLFFDEKSKAFTFRRFVDFASDLTMMPRTATKKTATIMSTAATWAYLLSEIVSNSVNC
jgi:hypothetical protein